MAQENPILLQGPKMDWTEDAELNKRLKNWREEVELNLETILANVKEKTTQAKFVILWAGREAHTYLSTQHTNKKNSVKAILDTLEDWTKPKADEIAAYTQLRCINQGQKTLSEFIVKIHRLADLCNFECDEDKNKIIRNSIIAGISSTKAYQQCISKGSSLTLEECIKICHMEDATRRQVQALQPECHTELQNSAQIHKIGNQSYRSRPGTRERGSYREAEDIAQVLKRTHVGTVETHGISDTRQNVKQMDKSATSATD